MARSPGFGIAVDGGGNAYITGLTSSTTFSGVTGSSIQPAAAISPAINRNSGSPPRESGR
jgi:hypothetical protein